MLEIQSAASNRKAFHPCADTFPLMKGDEFDELVGDMKRRGFRREFPIVTFQNQIIDGRNRERASEKAGVEPHYTEFQGKPEDVERFIIQANIHRRHLTAVQKREFLKKLLKLSPGQSDRQIAGEAKVSHHTVATARGELEATGQIAQLKATIGRDRKARQRPVKKRTREKDGNVPALLSAWDPALLSAWDKASDKQRHDFVRARNVEIMRIQRQIEKFACEEPDDGRDNPKCLQRPPMKPVTS